MALPILGFVHSLYIYYIYTFIIIYYLCIIVDIRETPMKNEKKIHDICLYNDYISMS